MAKLLSFYAVAAACSLLGLFFGGEVDCGFGSQHPHNTGRHHGPHPGWSRPGFGQGPMQPGFGPGQSGKPVPPSYTNFPGVGAYKFHAYGVAWTEAQRVCEQEGAKMLIVNSPAESETIRKLFKSNRHSPGAINSNHVWVGVQEKGTHGKFFTNDGQPLEQAGFLVWSKSPPQPNDPAGNDCVSFYSSGVLYDDACHLKYPFVCEF